MGSINFFLSLLRNISIFFFIIISSCEYSPQKEIPATNDDKFSEIVFEILKDTSYGLLEKKDFPLLPDNPIVTAIQLCCPDARNYFSSIYDNDIKVTSALFNNIKLYTKNPIRYGTCIELIQWIVPDSIMLNMIRKLVDCSGLVRCGIRNTYEPLFLKDRIFFSWIYDYDFRDRLKNPLKDVLKIYSE